MAPINYNQFKSYIKQMLNEHFYPETGESVLLRTFNIGNTCHEGFVLQNENPHSDSRLEMVVCLDDLYSLYCQKGISECYAYALNVFEQSKLLQNLSRDFIKEHVIIQLASAQTRLELNRIPHRSFLDLFLVYRLVLKSNASERVSHIITDNIAEFFHLSEVELFESAMANTNRLFPVRLVDMSIYPEDILKYDVIDEPNRFSDFPVRGLINDYTFYSASSVIASDYVKRYADFLEEDVYIAFTSMHEAIIQPVSSVNGDYHIMEQIVYDMLFENGKCLIPNEFLTTNIYRYCRATQRIEKMDDIVKQIDNKVGHNSFWQM